MDNEHAQLAQYVRGLEAQPEIMTRTFEKNRTVVEQDTKNACFYRLVSGSIRFEKRILDHKNIIKNVTILGTMDDTAPWSFFCELSAFGIQDRTSAAIVAESATVEIAVIPVEAFLAYTKDKQDFQLLFLRLITKRLAQMLRGLHSRTLNLSKLSMTTSGQQIHNEAVMFSWPCTVKSGFGKSGGELILSKNYISFVKKKVADRKGVVSDASDVPSQTIIALKEIVELTFNGAKVMVRDSSNKINVSLKKSENPEVVKDVLSMAKKSSNEIKKEQGTQGNSLTASIDAANADQTNVLSQEDEKLLLSKFQANKIAPGVVVQKNGEGVERIAYIVNGTLSVKIINEGKEVTLNDIVAGETAGDIGVFLDTKSSAELAAGAGGATILEIPKGFLFASGDGSEEFRVRLFFSLMKIMWGRIIRQETNQVTSWVEKMDKMCGDVSFLGESLMREGTGKNIDQMASLGWY